MNTLTAERLREMLLYDPRTGTFTWKASRRGAKAGSVAGSHRGRGYYRICIDGVFYRSHRLAWLYTHGEWPKHQIDHIDGNPSNNRISNLRDVTALTNSQNLRKASINNTSSGLLGVSWHVRHKKWSAKIRIPGARLHLGYFDDKHEAHAAYVAAKRLHHDGCTI